MYESTTNIDNVFNKVQELNYSCTLLDNRKIDKQLFTYAYLIFIKTGIYMDGLKSLSDTASTDKIFENL